MRLHISRLTPGMVIHTGRGSAEIIRKLPDRIDAKGRVVSRYETEGRFSTLTGVPQFIDVVGTPAKCECTSIDYCAYCLEKMSK